MAAPNPMNAASFIALKTQLFTNTAARSAPALTSAVSRLKLKNLAGGTTQAPNHRINDTFKRDTRKRARHENNTKEDGEMEEQVLDAQQKMQRKTAIYEYIQSKGLSISVEDDRAIEHLYAKVTEGVDEFGRRNYVVESQESASDSSSDDDTNYNARLNMATVSENRTNSTEERGWIKSSNNSSQDYSIKTNNIPHYRNTEERRVLGSGYYQFSLDEAQREKEMKELELLRKETIEKRGEMGHDEDGNVQDKVGKSRERIQRRLDLVQEKRKKREGKRIQELFHSVESLEPK